MVNPTRARRRKRRIQPREHLGSRRPAATGPRSGWRKGAWPKGIRASKTRPGPCAGKARPVRWSGYVKQRDPLAGNAGGGLCRQSVAGADTEPLRWPVKERGLSRRHMEPAATPVLTAKARTEARRRRSAGAVNCLSVPELRGGGGGEGRLHRLRHCQPATALTVIMAFHHRSVGPQARQACYGRDRPVNDSEVTERRRQPVTALTVIMALHPAGKTSLPWTRRACQRLGGGTEARAPR